MRASVIRPYKRPFSRTLEKIKFTKPQIIGLLEEFPSLKTKGISGRDVFLELETRLQACGIHGLMVKLYYTWEEDTETIAQYFGCSNGTIKRWIQRVLQYISGEKRKEIPFKQFVKQKLNRRYRS